MADTSESDRRMDDAPESDRRAGDGSGSDRRAGDGSGSDRRAGDGSGSDRRMDDGSASDRDDTSESRPRPDAEVVGIVAVAANGVIGRDGEMPWHLPEDMAHFERTTTGHPVVMGRRTYESIAAGLGGPLPDRTNVVLSRGDPDVAASVRVVDSLPAAFAAAETAIETEPDRSGPIFVAGGATVYEQCLPVVDRLVRTELEDSYAGDTEFPAWNREAWRETSRESYDAFDVVEYVRADEG